jgi:hypothetical protein
MADELSNFSLATHSFGSGFASANFQDSEDSRPSGVYLEALGGSNDPIQGIVQLSLARHISESIPHTSPQLMSHTNNWRKRLREMMIHQNETVLSFLAKPLGEQATVGPVEEILRRYAYRQDVDSGAIKTFKQLLDSAVAPSAATATATAIQKPSVQEEIASCVSAKGPSTLPEIKAQVNSLIELYKTTGDQLLDSENQLKLKVEKMDKIQKRVSTVIELQTNEATPELVAALENYLKVSFRDMNIEKHYRDILALYQKHIGLRDAIQVFKMSSQVVSEPLCPICLTDTIGTAISPCGHTFCNNCAKRMVMECGVCRGKIRDRLKLYFT